MSPRNGDILSNQNGLQDFLRGLLAQVTYHFDRTWMQVHEMAGRSQVLFGKAQPKKKPPSSSICKNTLARHDAGTADKHVGIAEGLYATVLC